MALFRRSDGDEVDAKELGDVRRFMPFLMRGRNESAVYHEATYDIGPARRWLAAYNRSHDQAATLFHLFLFALARVLHLRPGLHRFVSGGRIYRRKKVELSFAAKRAMDERSPIVSVKVELPASDDFAAAVPRIVRAIVEGRSDEEKAVDLELALGLALPGLVLRAVMRLLAWLDAWNLLPAAMTAHDPMFTSAFVANLGSIGLDRTFHHLFEYGTASLFVVLGAPRKAPLVQRDGTTRIADTVEARFTIDERINDGFYCAESLRLLRRIVEDPETHLGPAAAAPGDLAVAGGPAAPTTKPAP